MQHITYRVCVQRISHFCDRSCTKNAAALAIAAGIVDVIIL